MSGSIPARFWARSALSSSARRERLGRQVGNLGCPMVCPDEDLQGKIEGGERGSIHDGGTGCGVAEDDQSGRTETEPDVLSFVGLIDDREEPHSPSVDEISQPRESSRLASGGFPWW